MNNYRKTAIIVGVLFIIGTVAGVLSVAASAPVREATYLSSIAANPNQIVVGALFVLLMGLALALVPIVLFPLLKKYNEVLAIGYVVFRGALETALDIHLGNHRHPVASDNCLLVDVQHRRVYDLAGLDGLQPADSRAGNGDGRLVDREGLQFHGHRGQSCDEFRR